MQNQEAVIDRVNSKPNSDAHDVKKIKASFAGCPVSDRLLFSKSNCILPISIMGRKEHEDQRFIATMKLINSSFKSCTLLIVDSLYRHTLKIEYPNEKDTSLYDMSIEAGNSWLKRNKNAYQNLSIPHNIIRWDKYLNHPKFQDQFNVIACLYATNDQYRKTVDKNAEEYLDRYLSRTGNSQFNYQEAFSACTNYLKEECTGMCLEAEEEYHFEVCPTGRCAALAATYKQLIHPLHSDLLRPVGIRFKR